MAEPDPSHHAATGSAAEPTAARSSPSPGWSSPERRRFRLLFAGVAFCYLWFVPYFPKVNNPSENARVYQIRAMVELHKLSIDEQMKKYGWVNDLSRKDGKLYPNKAPGTAFLGAAIYGVHRAVERALGHDEVPSLRLLYVLRLFGGILPTLALLWLLRRFLGRVSDDAPAIDALVVTLGLGTMLYPYGILYVNHSLTAAASFGAVMAIHAGWRQRAVGGQGWLAFAGAGFLLASSVALDYGMFPLSVFTLLYLVVRLRGLPWPALLGTAAGGALPTLATAWYHKMCWGSPFRTAMSYLTNTKFATFAEQGFFGIIGPTRESLGVIVSRRGLLCFSPIFALALVATISACRSRRWRREAILSCVIVWWMIAYNISLVNWYAGWTVGPRYITVIAPFAIFSLAVAWQELTPRSRALVGPLAAGLGVASLVLTGLTSAVFPHLIPNYDNPFFEQTWPTWRDGMTPISVGQQLFGWRGRLDQAPFAIVFVVLSGYLLLVGARGGAGGTRLARRLGGIVAGLAVLAGVLAVLSIPKSRPRVRYDTDVWLRRDLWNPPLPSELIPQRDP